MLSCFIGLTVQTQVRIYNFVRLVRDAELEEMPELTNSIFLPLIGND